MYETLRNFGRYILGSSPPAPPQDDRSRQSKPGGSRYSWWIGGALLALLLLTVALLSARFDRAVPLKQRPVLLLTTLLVLAGMVFLYLVARIPRTAPGKRLMAGVLILGGMLRLFLLFTTPILEDDYFRYLWDGAVTAQGLNPYADSPAEIQAALSGAATEVDPTLIALAKESGAIIDHINHSYLRSIYPPVTQAAFALAHWIEPWSMVAWRLVLLLADLANLMLLFYLLRYLHLSPLWIAVYWLNPLLLKEMMNSGHMDLLIFPFLLGALALSLRERPFAAVILLALAAAVKLWPVALLPIVLRPLYPDYRRLLTALLLFAGLSLALFAPVYLSGLNEGSGFHAYGQRWQLNDSAFKILLGISAVALKAVGIHPGHSQVAARILVLVIVGGWIVYLTLQKPQSQRQVLDQVLLIVAALFLLSPTQFPWYGVWLVPLLVISPRQPLLLLTALLPLYYLRYYWDARGAVELFDNYIVWLEFVPVWILLLRDWYRARRQRPAGDWQWRGIDKKAAHLSRR